MVNWARALKASMNFERETKPASVEMASSTSPITEELTVPELISIDENDAALDAEALLVVEEMKDEQQAVITDAVMDAEAMLEVEAMKEE